MISAHNSQILALPQGSSRHSREFRANAEILSSLGRFRARLQALLSETAVNPGASRGFTFF
jgi:hypothetical protein